MVRVDGERGRKCVPGGKRSSKNGKKAEVKYPSGLELIPSGRALPFVRFGRVETLQSKTGKSSSRNEAAGFLRPNHVSSCTCPLCCRANRLSQKAPVVLRFKCGIRLVEATLEHNNFMKTNKDDWNIMWVTGGLKPHLYQGLSRFQKINQFPRTYEITRKDQLCRNISRMQQLHGARHFGFFPKSFVLPGDRDLFEKEVRQCMNANATASLYEKDVDFETRRKENLWIVKPAASACGRGIYVTDNIGEIPLGGLDDTNVLVSKYISNPLLLDERKFDLRVYVAITSFTPLRVYVYEEGLVRLTTEAYNSDDLNNKFVHLTNYSVQKHSKNFIPNEGKDANNEDDESSSKWSFKTFRARLEKMGHDPKVLFESIDELIIKTLISIEPQVVTAMDMHVRHPDNCFQLFGFDVLIDTALKPWLLEVNLGPSLSCDSQLDLSIKSSMLADLMTLSGVHPSDIRRSRTNEDLPKKSSNNSQSANALVDEVKLSKMLKQLRYEQERSGGWACVYPTKTSFVYERYFLDKRPYNAAIVQSLSANTSVSNKKRIAKVKLKAKK